MNTDKNSQLYGVCGITNSFKDMIPASSLPLMIETVLLPFKDKIIYDSLMNFFNVSFGRGIRSGFKESLTDEYKEVCLNVLAKLARKRPSPLVSGRTNTWACGVVYTVAMYNGAFDDSNQNYLVEIEVADWFGIAKRTASSQMNKIDKLLGISNLRIDVTVRRH